MGRAKKIILLGIALIVLITAGVALWFYRLDKNITKSLSEKQLIPVIEFYSAPVAFTKGQKLKNDPVNQHFQRLRYRPRTMGQTLAPGDYSVWSAEECRTVLPDLPEELGKCVAFRNRDPLALQKEPQILALTAERVVLDIYTGNPPHPTNSAGLDVEAFAQFIGDQAIIKKSIDLGDTPPLCLNAVLAIEDASFLEHGGVSWKGVGRAVIRNVTGGRIAQGGSTITQQLVKNYFLTSERTFKRKITEMAMAILLEARATKDDILQSYINEIYMGQNGSFQIRGWGAASEFYFSKELTDLSLSECSLLAALVNAPGLFDPFKHPERSGKRRELVLKRMLETEVIDQASYDIAVKEPLPKSRKRILSEPAPFFVDAVKKHLTDNGIDMNQGLRVYTTLNQEAQEAALIAVRTGLQEIDTNSKKVKELKEKGKNLEGVVLAADPKTGYVEAAVGGRSFRSSQFNRLTSAHRQVGSVMKPAVFLAALINGGKNEPTYTPLTLIDDSPQTITYEKQKWKPENYGKKYFGNVPMFFALKESLNSSTARIAMDVGLDKVVDVAHAAGVTSPLQPLPSLALGSFELFPWEVLQMYATFSQLGVYTPLTFVTRVENVQGEVIFKHEVHSEPKLDAHKTAVLVSMMKQTLENGTAASVRLRGFTHPAAGKTGTTNDNRDAWFAGFTPHHVAVAWVGFDDNTPHGLTGASGGVPLWTYYMRAYAAGFAPDDFPWPEDTEEKEISVEDQTALNVPNDEKKPLAPVFLRF